MPHGDGLLLQVVFVLYAVYDVAKSFRSNVKFTPSWFLELILDMLIVICLVVVRPRDLDWIGSAASHRTVRIQHVYARTHTRANAHAHTHAVHRRR